ncbi:MAG: serine/threonine-protein kinase [Candidatus Melainabacteria bacterium]|nr:serine/threonine-protein kinase [Candidatus Melainabacteria bacterium]
MTNHSKVKRVMAEVGSFVNSSGGSEVSCFAGSANAEICLRLAALRIYRKLDQRSVFFGTFLKTNLAFLAILVFYCTYNICSSPDRLYDLWFGPVVLGACLPAVLTITSLLVLVTLGLWILEKPKRLKVLPSNMVLRMELTDELFAEIVIPWSSVDRIELKHLNRFTPDKELHLVIETALGARYTLRYDDLLMDNSRASFLNAVRTWAPHAFCQLSSEQNKGVAAAQFTELWLHQFSTANIRQRDGLLAPGLALKGDRYTVVGVLGGGGQGNAYLACDNHLDSSSTNAVSDVVLKEYIMPVYQGSAVLERLSAKLKHESDILTRLDHPGVVKLLDCFVEDYRGYLVLEFVEGRSLKELVQSEGVQAERFVREVGAKLCQVLIYLHDCYPPVIHRDLTPDNIMLDMDGEIKVVDFNVARQLENATGATVVGKHSYIPPEQFRGKPCAQSDIYALGSTLYFLLTAEEPVPLTCSHPCDRVKISSDLDRVVARATALALDQRYGSARELLADLTALH